MIARSEITNGILNRRHLDKREYPKKWTPKSMVSLPNCGHRKKGKVPIK